MASIRLTIRDKDDIQSKIRSMFSRRESELRSPPSEDLFDRIAAYFISVEFNPERFNIPNNWFSPVKYVSVPVTIPEGTHTFTYENITPVTVPYIRRFIASDGNTLTIPKDFKLSEELEHELHPWVKSKIQLNEESTLFISQSNTVIKNSNTLQQFLKQWPAGIEFVPNELKRKLELSQEELKAKVKAKEKPEPIDTSHLNSTLLRHRLFNNS